VHDFLFDLMALPHACIEFYKLKAQGGKQSGSSDFVIRISYDNFIVFYPIESSNKFHKSIMNNHEYYYVCMFI
jgi:hypothetical protein